MSFIRGAIDRLTTGNKAKAIVFGDEVDVEDVAAYSHDYPGHDQHLETECDPKEEDADERGGSEAEDGLSGPEIVGEHSRGDLHDPVDYEEGRDEEVHRALVYV